VEQLFERGLMRDGIMDVPRPCRSKSHWKFPWQGAEKYCGSALRWLGKYIVATPD